MAKNEEETLTGWALLRKPFPAHQIGKLPKPTKAQMEAVKVDYRKGIRCNICGQWHHPEVVHLDYVGHAALTDRLLDVDPEWTWEPLALDAEGLPKTDRDGGLWIKLTILNVTRYGYGHTDKSGGDAVKELIGDALRNAAMRFGCALELWHKGDLHKDEDGPGEDNTEPTRSKPWSDQDKLDAKVTMNEFVQYLLDHKVNEADAKTYVKTWQDQIGDEEIPTETWQNRVYTAWERCRQQYEKGSGVAKDQKQSRQP